MTETYGTLGYQAPEVLKKSYTNKADIWSVGIVTFILICGHPPFQGTEAQINDAISRAKFPPRRHFWSSGSADARDFIDSLLCGDICKRPSARAALHHHWILSRTEGHSQLPALPSIHLNFVKALHDFQDMSKL